MYDDILIPVDGSSVAENAAKYAIQEAKFHDATLHVISVITIQVYESPEANLAQHGQEQLEEMAENFIEEITSQVDEEEVEVVSEVLVGQPPSEICTYAESNDMDLIVMGTHGRSGVKRVLLGSVAERVVRTSDVPVMTVHE